MIPGIDLDDVVAKATRLARRRFLEDKAIGSVTLSDSFDHDHPNARSATARRVGTYYRREWLPGRLRDAVETMASLVADPAAPVVAWRSIVVSEDPVETFRRHVGEKGIGLHWSHERDNAHPHMAFGDTDEDQYLIEGRIDPAGIDWVSTIASYGHPDWVGEEEIALLPDARVEIVSLVKRKGWLSRLEGDVETEIAIGALAGAVVSAGRASVLSENAPSPVP